MAVFPSFNLTKKGEELLNRSIGEGRVLTFTKFKIGDGVPTGDWRDLDNLQSSFKEFPVLETAIQADQVLRIRGYFDNKGFATDKQFKEIGVFVTLDGVAGEHLYSYTNAGDTGDIIPAETRGFYSRTLDVNNYIGYATNITFNIEQTRDNYDFNTENELKVATFLKKGDKIRLWGRLVLGDIETLSYIVTDEATSLTLDNGLYCKLAGDNRAFTVENDLINLKGAVVGDVVEVLGFHTKGDGSSHKRIAKAEDDGSGEQGQNGIWWCIVHSGEVNVSWFGAKGDGVADDYTSIQKALNIGKAINFDKKKYTSRTELVIDSNKTLNGNNCEVFRLSDSTWKYNNSVFTTASYSSDSDKCENIEISNFSLKSNRGKEVICGLNICNSKNVKIKNITTDGFGYGIRIGFSQYVTVERCLTTYANDDGLACSDGELLGKYENNKYISVIDCVSEYNAMDTTCFDHMNGGEGTSGFEVDDGGSFIKFTNCIARHNGGRGFNIHIHTSTTDIYSDIHDISFVDCEAYSNLQPSESNRTVYDWNNTGFSSEVSNALFNKIYNITYIRCKSRDHRHTDFVFDPGYQVQYDCNISLYSCEAMSEGVAGKSGLANFHFDRANGIKVESCKTDSNFRKMALKVDRASHFDIVIKNNKFVNFARSAVHIRGMENRVTGTINTYVTGNVFDSPGVSKTSGSENCLYFRDVQSIVIKDNIINHNRKNGLDDYFIMSSDTSTTDLTYIDLSNNDIRDTSNTSKTENSRFISFKLIGDNAFAIIKNNKATTDMELQDKLITIFKEKDTNSNSTAIVTNNCIATKATTVKPFTILTSKSIVEKNIINGNIVLIYSALDTPYYTLKMQQEGIYEEYVAYRDELHEYKNSQTTDETMLLPVLHEPVIPESVELFAKKYNLI